MYKFKIGNYVSELIEATTEAIAKIQLAEHLGIELRDLPRNIETFKLD